MRLRHGQKEPCDTKNIEVCATHGNAGALLDDTCYVCKSERLQRELEEAKEKNEDLTRRNQEVWCILNGMGLRMYNEDETVEMLYENGKALEKERDELLKYLPRPVEGLPKEPGWYWSVSPHFGLEMMRIDINSVMRLIVSRRTADGGHVGCVIENYNSHRFWGPLVPPEREGTNHG